MQNAQRPTLNAKEAISYQLSAIRNNAKCQTPNAEGRRSKVEDQMHLVFCFLPPASRLPLIACCLLLASFSFALAQPASDIAKQAVKDWQAGKYSVDAGKIVGQTPEEAIKLLERNLAFSPPPTGISINLNEPKEEKTQTGTIVNFPAVVADQGGDVRVTVRGGEVTRIGFVPEGGLLPGWLSSPFAWVVFILLSLGWVWALRGNNPLATWWREGWAIVRQYRGLYLGVNVVLYGLFILGSAVAYANPRLVKLMQEVVGGALEQIGIGPAIGSGVLGLAVVIFYWNFSNGLLITTALPGLFLGIPALLFNAARYFVLGFALSPMSTPLAAYLLHIPTIIVELQGYILGTFGGMVLLMEVVRRGGFSKGLRALGLMVYLGAFFLMVGAWYEAIEVLFLIR